MRSQIVNIILLAISIACCLPFISNGQVTYEGQIVDKNTELAVQGVTVRLLKENIAASTNAQGYFRLTSNSTQLNDTLIFSSVGYYSFRLPVSLYRENLFLLLHPRTTDLQEVGITNRKLKDLTLNKFVWADIAQDRDDRTQPFTAMYAFAKLFAAPNGNMVLKNIALGRRSFQDKNEERPLIKSSPKTRFRLHLLTVNPATGGPGAVLFTKEVQLDDNAALIRVDLSKDAIVIADRQFYIAVEWLRIPLNELVRLNIAPKIRKVTRMGGTILEDVAEYSTVYQPALIGMRQRRGAISWTQNEKGKWVPYNTATRGRGLEIALSATVHH